MKFIKRILSYIRVFLFGYAKGGIVPAEFRGNQDPYGCGEITWTPISDLVELPNRRAHRELIPVIGFEHDILFPDEEIIKDDMLFKPYPMGGYQCIIPTRKGNISVRYGSPSLFAAGGRPYEVRYPDRSDPKGYQTANDIFEYIKKLGE